MSSQRKQRDQLERTQGQRATGGKIESSRTQQKNLQQEQFQKQRPENYGLNQQKRQQQKASQSLTKEADPSAKQKTPITSGRQLSGPTPKSSKSAAVGQSKSTSPGTAQSGPDPAASKSGAPRRLYYQQADSKTQDGTGSQGTGKAASGTTPATSGTSAKSPAPAGATGGASSSSGQSSAVTPPANAAEGYSRLKAAKEALEYYTSGNGRFVKDRDAQIEKLRQEISFLEKYQQSGGTTSSASTSQGKAPPAVSTPATNSSTSTSPVTKSAGTASTPTTRSMEKGKNTAVGGGSASSPTGYTNVYDNRGNKVSEKPYWGSGTKADPYRDYQDLNKPFEDRIWGSGTKQDPFTNIVTPPKASDQSPHLPGAGSASVGGGETGSKSGQRGADGLTAAPDQPKSSTPPLSSRGKGGTSEVKEAQSRLRNLEKDFDEAVKLKEQAIDSFFDKTRDEFQRTLGSYRTGENIITKKIENVLNSIKKAQERGDAEEEKNLDRDLAVLMEQSATLAVRQQGLLNWLNNEQSFRSDMKDSLRLTQETFKMENQRLLSNLTNYPGGEIANKLQDHLSKWDPNKLPDYHYDKLQHQSPLVEPKTYNPISEKSKADKDKWRNERKASIGKEYENKIQEIENEPLAEGAGSAVDSIGKQTRIQQLEMDKEAKQRQIDVIYRESLIKSGRLTQDEYNALNTPEWQEKLDKYRQDLKQGRVSGDRPTP